MAPKGSSGVGKARSYGVSKPLEKTTTHDLGFGAFDRSEPTAEGERLLKAVQNAAVGTEITVQSDGGYGAFQYETYRVTGTTHEKKLVATKPATREYFQEQGIESWNLSDRESLSELLFPMFENGRVTKLRRTPLTAQERRDLKAEQKRDRARRAAERRQYKFDFD